MRYQLKMLGLTLGSIMARTLYDKIWDEHVVHTEEDGTSVLYSDRH